MLIEDNEDDAFFMKLALKKAGVENPLFVATDGQRAIELLQEAMNGMDRDEDGSPVIPCLVLLDLKLPKLRGHEVLKWIRQQPALKTIPVVVLSASPDDHDIETAYELGANSYFAKPSDTDGLIQLVKLLSDYWLKRCLPPPTCIEKPPELCVTPE